MKINSLIKKIILFSTMMSVIGHISADQNNKDILLSKEKNQKNQLSLEEENYYKKILKEVTDQLLEATLSQLKKIDYIIENLSLATKNNIVPNVDKNKTLKELKSIRKIIFNVRKSPFTNIDTKGLHFLINFNTTLIKELTQSIRTNLNNIDTIHTKLKLEYLPDSESLELSIEDLQKQLMENEMLCLTLNQEAEQIGLTFWNKAFRKLHNFYEPYRRSSKWKYLKAGTIASIVGLTYFYKFSNAGKTNEGIIFENAQNNYLKGGAVAYKIGDNIKTIEDLSTESFNAYTKAMENPSFSQWLRYYLGHSPTGYSINPHENVYGGLFTSIEKRWHIPAFLAAGVTMVYGKHWPIDLRNWMGQHFNWWYYRQLGGILSEKANSQIKESSTELIPKVTFDDIVGLDHIKSQLIEVLEYIQNPERFDRVGVKPECGFLFTGKPGTGKSFIAEGLGGEIQKIFKKIGRSSDEIGFYSINASMIKDSKGKTASRQLELIMELAANEAPCVLFIDEIDLLKLQRADGDTTLLSTFLSTLSGVLSAKTHSQVIVIAATNKPENLDPALTRPGRLGKTIHFEMPTFKERKNFFIKKLQPLLPSLDYIDIDSLSGKTHNYSYKHLDGIVDFAFRKAKLNKETLTQKHLEQGILEIAYDLISGKLSNIPFKEKKIIAAHQAGKLIATMLLQPSINITSITIEPYNAELKEESASAQYYGPRTQKDIRYGRIFKKYNNDPLDLISYEEKINKAKVILAGAISEKIIMGSTGHSYNTNDKQEALDIIKSLVFEGLHVKSMPKSIQQEYFKKALNLLKKCELEVTELLEKNKKNIEKIVNQLIQRKTLSIDEIKKIIK